jgi:hypothetical protein
MQTSFPKLSKDMIKQIDNVLSVDIPNLVCGGSLMDASICLPASAIGCTMTVCMGQVWHMRAARINQDTGTTHASCGLQVKQFDNPFP